MTDQARDQAEPVAEDSLDAWGSSTGPAWVAPDGATTGPAQSLRASAGAAAAAGWVGLDEPAGTSSSSGGSTRAAAMAKLADEHPEVVIGAALVGGFLLAAILKRLAR